jgi:hypothetical protein
MASKRRRETDPYGDDVRATPAELAAKYQADVPIPELDEAARRGYDVYMQLTDAQLQTLRNEALDSFVHNQLQSGFWNDPGHPHGNTNPHALTERMNVMAQYHHGAAITARQVLEGVDSETNYRRQREHFLNAHPDRKDT